MTTKKKTSKTEKLLEALRSGYESVRRAAASNPNATPEVLLVAVKDEEACVRYQAAANPSATPEVLLLVLKGRSPYVRRAAAANPNATPEVLLVALKDKNEWVRRHAARNPNIKSLNLSTDKWLELVAGGFFEGSLKNIPHHVKKDPRYKSIRLLSKLANP